MDTRLLHYLSEFCVSVIVLAFLGLSLAGCLGPQVPSVHFFWLMAAFGESACLLVLL